MVCVSHPIVPTIPLPRFSSPVSFARRHIYSTYMMSLALIYAIIAITATVEATYRAPSDCPIQHCLLEPYQPTTDYFPFKIITEQNPNFAVEYYHNFKLLKNFHTKEEYVITLCGTPAPTNGSMVYRTINGSTTQVPLVLAPTAKFIVGPITKVAIDETITANMMELIGARGTISAMDVTYITSPCLHSMNAMQFLTTFPYGNQTRRQELINQVDIVIGGNMPNSAPKFVQASVTAELKPQGRLEWIKFIGALLNREYAAQLIYNQTLQRYNTLKTKIANVTAGQTLPTVAWIEFSKGNVNWGTVDTWRIMNAEYKLQFTRDAGAIPFNPQNNTFTDVTQALKTLVDGDVDIVIDETYINYYGMNDQNINNFATVWGNVTNTIPFMQFKQVWRHDRMTTSTGGDDWFERAIVQIDAVLQDMIVAIHPNKAVPKDTPTVWFRNFAVGEPAFSTLDRCIDISAPLYPLLAEPVSQHATCPILPIETFIDYKPISNTTSSPTSTPPPTPTPIPTGNPGNGVVQIGAGVVSIMSIIVAVLLM